MLQAMHSKAASWIAKLLAVLLIISFAAWGITDYLTPGAGRSDVAKVGETSVTANEFNEQFRNAMERMRRVLGASLDSEQARQLGLADSTLEDLILRRLLREQSHAMGLLIGDDQIRAQILKEPAFRNPAGQFDPAFFQQILRQNGMTEARYVAGLRSQIARDNLTDIIDAGSAPPDFLSRVLYSYQNEKRSAEFVIYPRSLIAKPARPGEAALREFHKKKSTLFEAPELRDVSVIHLDPAAFAEGMTPSKEKVRQEYQVRLASLKVPERRKLRQIVTQDKETAEKAVARLRSGEKLKPLAKALGGGTRGVDLGLVAQSQLPPELAGAAFRLKKGQVSAPVKTPLGWHVLHVTEVHPGRTPKFEDVRDGIRKDLALEQARDSLVELSNRLTDTLAGGISLEQAARDIGARVVTFKGISIQGRTAAGKTVGGLPAAPKFLGLAFDTPSGGTSDIADTGDGGYLVVRVDGVIKPALRPFESVREQVVAAWQFDRQNSGARKKAEAILAKLKAGMALEQAAAGTGLKIINSKLFTRFNREAGSKLPGELAAKLFALKPGGADMSESEDGYAVARLKRIVAADPVKDRERLKEVQTALSRAIAGDLLSQFSQALRGEFPVVINRQAIDSLFNETSR